MLSAPALKHPTSSTGLRPRCPGCAAHRARQHEAEGIARRQHARASGDDAVADVASPRAVGGRRPTARGRPAWGIACSLAPPRALRRKMHAMPARGGGGPRAARRTAASLRLGLRRPAAVGGRRRPARLRRRGRHRGRRRARAARCGPSDSCRARRAARRRARGPADRCGRRRRGCRRRRARRAPCGGAPRRRRVAALDNKWEPIIEQTNAGPRLRVRSQLGGEK